MGLAWGVLCLDCMEQAPNIGDCGFLGVPTLSARVGRTQRWRIPGHVDKPRTFGALYTALEGVGVLLQDAVDFRGFLKGHDAHDLFLYNDHMDQGDLHPRLPGWDWSGVKRRPTPWPTAGVKGHCLISCPHCSDELALQYAVWHERDKIELTRTAVDSFERLLRADADNFCRLHSAVEPQRGLQRVADFLKSHRFHRLFSQIEPRSWEQRRVDADDA